MEGTSKLHICLLYVCKYVTRKTNFNNFSWKPSIFHVTISGCALSGSDQHIFNLTCHENLIGKLYLQKEDFIYSTYVSNERFSM